MAALAGPVVAAACLVTPDTRLIRKVNDSKVLTRLQREELLSTIRGRVVKVGIGAASVAEIHRLNIYHASHVAMTRALRQIGEYDWVLVHGRRILDPAFAPTDYEALIAVNREAYPDYAESLAEWRHWDDSWDAKKYFKHRVVAEDGGRVVGWGQINHMPWAFVANKYRIDLTVLREFRRRGHGSALHDALLATASGRGAISVQGQVKESLADGLAFALHRGYEERKRDWESRLFVRRFDFSRFAGADERVAAQGIRVTTLAAERERDPRALEKAHELSEDCSRDAPSVDPHTPRPFAEWLRNVIEAPNVLPDGYFIAVAADGRYLGLSNLYAALDDG